ncbi:tyrosine-type recombinase/integrase [Clostridium fessum]|uniref:tyrosine-type recombinase/integrase n=1 Tax=Clostridium fessum TaxID=2126740 RepID=UPI002FD82C99
MFFPRSLCGEAIPYFASRGIDSGFLFLTRRRTCISARAIEMQLKKIAKRYRINPATMYPHSFRHRYAINFLKRFNDISLLADLLGHDSIETTRIYLMKSSQEQQTVIDRVVTW